MFIKIVNSFGIRVIGVIFAYALNLYITRNYEQSTAGLYFWLTNCILFIAPIISVGLPTLIMKESAINRGLPYEYFIKSILLIIPCFTLCALLLFLIRELTLSEKIYYLVLLAPAILLYSLTVTFSEVFRGVSDFNKYTISLFLILQVFLCITNIVNSGELNNLIQNYYFSIITCAIFIMYFVRKKIVHVKSTYSVKTIFLDSYKIMFSTILQSLVTYFAIIITGIICNVEQVALLHIALRTSLLVGFLMTAINTVIGPKLTSYETKKEEFYENIIEVKKLLGRCIILIIPFTIIVCYFSKWILSIFGEEYIGASMVFQLLIVSQVINIVSGPVILVLNVTGNQILAFKSMVYSSITVVLGSIFLIPTFGYKGAAVAIATAIMVQNLVALVYVKRRLGIWLLPIMQPVQTS